MFKIDWALGGPIPWTNAAVRGAGTVHVGGRLDEVAASEAEVAAGRHPERPFVLVVQQSLFDPSRAPAGRAHGVGLLPRPAGVDGRHDRPHRGPDRALRARLRRPRPGPRHEDGAAAMAAYDENYVGGDINVGLQDWRQLDLPAGRRALDPYATPAKGIYLCSSATPPGGGVHGMCGHLAARSALPPRVRPPAPEWSYGRVSPR